MNECKKIIYQLDKESGIEVIMAEHSAISYPLHNHVSVYTIGILLEGEILVALEDNVQLCSAGDVFVIPPYLPHYIKCVKEYSLLSVCIKMEKNQFEADGFIESSIRRAAEQIVDFPWEKYSVEKMAKQSFLSKYQFIRNFKKNVGLTPHQFQIQNRIRRAKQWIREGQSVTEVAFAAGFCDQSHFIKYFEKQVGLTPTDYRRSCI